MSPTFHQEQQACLGKGAVRAFIIGTVTKGFSIALRVSYRLDRPIYGKQTHPFPEGSRGLCTRFGSCTASKEFLQDFAPQLFAPITEGRPDGDLLGHIVAR